MFHSSQKILAISLAALLGILSLTGCTMSGTDSGSSSESSGAVSSEVTESTESTAE